MVVKNLSYLTSEIKLSIHCIFSSQYLSLLRRHCYPSWLTRSADRLCLFVTWQLMSTQLFIGTLTLHLLWPKPLTFAALDGNTFAPRPKQPYLSHFLEVLVDSFVPPTAVVQKLIYMHKTKGYCGRDFSSAAASAFRSTERAFHASVCPSVRLSDCLAMN